MMSAGSSGYDRLSSLLPDILATVGAAAVVCGVALWSLPAALVAGGGVAIVVAVALAWRR